jgi:hypothetical protein
MHTGYTANPVSNAVNESLSDGVVATSNYTYQLALAHIFKVSGIHTVVGGIFLSAYQLIRVEQMAVNTSAYFVNGLGNHPSVNLTPFRDTSHLVPTEGSRSTKTDRGTYLPFPVSVKNVS